MFTRHLTLKSADGWQSQAKFPFINVGTRGIYNITAAEGMLGVEIRPIPQDDTELLKRQWRNIARKTGWRCISWSWKTASPVMRTTRL